MAIRLYRAYSPGTRTRSDLYFTDLTKTKPEKKLTFGKKRCGGRNNRGLITLRGRGGDIKENTVLSTLREILLFLLGLQVLNMILTETQELRFYTTKMG